MKKTKPNGKDIKQYEDIANSLHELYSLNPDADMKAFDSWREKNAYASHVVDKLTNERLLKRAILSQTSYENKSEDYLRKLHIEMSSTKGRKRKLLAYASIAVAVLFVSFLVYFTDTNKPLNTRKVVLSSLIEENIGSVTKPTLISENGHSVELKSILGQQNVKPTVEELNHLLMGVGTTSIDPNITLTPTMNTLVIPKQEMFLVVLPDSTEVLLNANTVLKYPSHFVGSERKVSIQGEAYFKVTKSDVPFIVTANNIDIRVYGTEFNVNTHIQDEIQTVLVTGSVGVTNNTHNTDTKEYMLSPNQKYSLNSVSGTSTVSDVDVASYLAWMKPDFDYTEVSLIKIIQDVEKWYNIDIKCHEEQIKDINISICTSKEEQLINVLKSIEDISDLLFINEGGGQYVLCK